jgi:hypothetical protein
VTVTSTVPDPPGEVAVICVSLSTWNHVASWFGPNSTSDAPVKPVPVIVIVFPPHVAPSLGVSLVIVGAAAIALGAIHSTASTTSPATIPIILRRTLSVMEAKLRARAAFRIHEPH